MKLNQLRDVIAIAERGSLRAAARHLGLAQPALSRSIHELERELNAPLFERRARGMTLTPMGAAFVRRASVALKEIQRAGEEVEQLKGGTGGMIVAGLSIAAHLALLPHALGPFRKRYPDVRLHIIEGLFPTLELGLKDGNIDFYVGPRPGRGLPSELVEEKLLDNTRTILGRKGHPLGKARSLHDLTEAEWATTSITLHAEDELDALFTSRQLPKPRLVLRSQSALTLIVSLAYSDLLAMVPRQWTAFDITAGALAPILVKEKLSAPPMVMIRRGGLPLTPAADFFVDLMRRQSLRATRPDPATVPIARAMKSRAL
ncbi:MAG: LysR substrate-binding domain-containing protein [Stellaceae bacterium]